MWNANGILIQSLDEQTRYVTKFLYSGINAYFLYPLVAFSDRESKILTYEQQTRQIAKNKYLSLDFITNSDLFERYVKKCKEMDIPIRTLFIESSYEKELWDGELPEKEFIGYEYCPLPIDEQIITDMDWYTPFIKYHKKLNQHGLFDEYDIVQEFAYDYSKAFDQGMVGDGNMDAYICKVYLINDTN